MSDDLLSPAARGAVARGLRTGVAVAVVAALVASASPAAAEPAKAEPAKAQPAAAEPAKAEAAGARTVRVSVADRGQQGDQGAQGGQISANGRYVVFVSTSSNLVTGDTNSRSDVFVRDRRAGTTIRVSVSSSGAQADGSSHGGGLISADGRHVAFLSFATNLVPGDTNGQSDVFVRDLRTGRTSRVSVSSAGVQANDFSATSLALTADGRYVVFDSQASNLVAGDTNGFSDVFLHDRRTGRTDRLSVSTEGVQGDHVSHYPAISADGRYVAFESFAGTLVADDTNGFSDIFVRDRRTGRTTLISRVPGGAPSGHNSFNPSISADGRFIAFGSDSPDYVRGDTHDMVDVFVRDRRTGRTTLASVSSSGRQANDHSNVSSISADGRYVVFSSPATNLVPGDRNASEDVFVRDRRRGTTTRANVATSGRQANGYSSLPSISADGRVVAFVSEADNLVAGDTNAAPDVFVRVRR